MTRKILFISFLFIFSVALSGCTQQQGECSDELKICPDGSEVSRKADNNCRFDSCAEKEEKNISEEDEQSNEDKEIVADGGDKIKIFDINSGDAISSPITIKGEGTAFENTLLVELRNNNHEALVKEFVNIHSSEVGQSGPFEITLHFAFQNTKEGYIAVYEESAKDGSELNLVEIPVKFNVDNN